MPGDDNNEDPSTAVRDRRRGYRFPLRLSVRYRSIGSPAGSDWTVGESVNISRVGLLFTSPEAVMPGQKVEALISWPVFLDNRLPLKLVIKGLVARNADDGTAMCFNTYEFRTCRTPCDSNLETP